MLHNSTHECMPLGFDHTPNRPQHICLHSTNNKWNPIMRECRDCWAKCGKRLEQSTPIHRSKAIVYTFIFWFGCGFSYMYGVRVRVCVIWMRFTAQKWRHAKESKSMKIESATISENENAQRRSEVMVRGDRVLLPDWMIIEYTMHTITTIIIIIIINYVI